MAEKIYPAASKPPPPPPPSSTTAPPPSFPANNKPLARPVYRPNSNRNNRRSCCCSIFLLVTVVIAIVIFLLAVTAAAAYVIYRPQRPTFSVSSLHVTSFNVTSSNKLNARFNLTLAARNPNKRIAYLIDEGDVTVGYEESEVAVGKVDAFTMRKKGTTSLRSLVTSSDERADDGESDLKSELKGRKSVGVRIVVDTKIRAKTGSVKTKRVPIRVTCDGVKAGPTGATLSAAKCEVDLRIKIWKWTV